MYQLNFIPQKIVICDGKIYQIAQETTKIDFKNVIPATCRKVKLYVFGQSGYIDKVDHRVRWEFQNTVDKFCFSMHPYHQNAWTTSNWNGDVNLDDSQSLKITRQGGQPSGICLEVQIIAYYE